MENLHDLFSQFKVVERQIRNNSGGHKGLYQVDSFHNVCDYVITESLSFNPSDVIKIAEPLLSAIQSLEKELDSLEFRNPELDLFDPDFAKGGYTKDEAKKLIEMIKDSLHDIIDTHGASLNLDFKPIPIGTNIKTFANLMGVMVRAGIIIPDSQEEMYRFIQRSFTKKNGEKSTIGVIRNNFKKLDESGAYSPEKILDIIKRIKSQAEKDS